MLHNANLNSLIRARVRDKIPVRLAPGYTPAGYFRFRFALIGRRPARNYEQLRIASGEGTLNIRYKNARLCRLYANDYEWRQQCYRRIS